MSCCNKSKNPIKVAKHAAIAAAVSNRRLLQHIERWRQPEDKGLGDTLKHVAAYFGADKFTKWLKKWGVDCGCEDEQAYWNKEVPYSPTPSK